MPWFCSLLQWFYTLKLIPCNILCLRQIRITFRSQLIICEISSSARGHVLKIHKIVCSYVSIRQFLNFLKFSLKVLFVKFKLVQSTSSTQRDHFSLSVHGFFPKFKWVIFNVVFLLHIDRAYVFCVIVLSVIKYLHNRRYILLNFRLLTLSFVLTS